MRHFSAAIIAMVMFFSASSASAQILVPTPSSDAQFFVGGTAAGPAHSGPLDFGTIHVTVGGPAYQLCPQQDPFTLDWLYQIKINGVHEGWLKFLEPTIVQGHTVYPWCFPDGTGSGFLAVLN